jgi:hypothetical protein
MPARGATHECLVPGCPLPGHNQLGVRCRVAHSGASPFPNKRRTDAIWSVESAGYLCDQHALAGGRMRLTFEPDGSQEASITAASGEHVVEERSKPIRQPLEEAA